MKRAIIFGASKITDYESTRRQINNDDLIICADGGYEHAKVLGIKPDVVIGDFDSYDKSSITDAGLIITAKTQKDETDIELALLHAYETGSTDVLMFGSLYGRLDHTFANIWLLLKYERLGIHVTMIGDDDIVMSSLRSITINKIENSYISLYALSKSVKGLTLKGLKYTLLEHELKQGDVLGTSNEFISDIARISFDEGELLIIISKKRGTG